MEKKDRKIGRRGRIRLIYAVALILYAAFVLLDAFVIPREGVSLSENELREYCKDRIAFYKTPKYFFIVNEFPLTASGKIQKFKLREQAKKLVGIK